MWYVVNPGHHDINLKVCVYVFCFAKFPQAKKKLLFYFTAHRRNKPRCKLSIPGLHYIFRLNTISFNELKDEYKAQLFISRGHNNAAPLAHCPLAIASRAL